jgi:23S rRNA (guanine745-N1)-methyltransferase
MVALICPVRDCAARLTREERTLRCDARHTFDLAKSGYANLLQPQDRKARDPGDRRLAVLARQRTAERGLTAALVALLLSTLASELAREQGPVLDVGCGDGFVVAKVAERLACETWGVDISRAAVDHAARRYPKLGWVVANGDRRMPFADGSFAAILSITGPKNAVEFRRLLAHGGLLLVAVSGPDDQAELRQAVLGAAHRIDRSVRMRELFGEHFELIGISEARQREHLDSDALRDLLDGAYRGARHAARQRFEALSELDVTLSHQLLAFRVRDENDPKTPRR